MDNYLLNREYDGFNSFEYICTTPYFPFWIKKIEFFLLLLEEKTIFLFIMSKLRYFLFEYVMKYILILSTIASEYIFSALLPYFPCGKVSVLKQYIRPYIC